MLTPMSASIYGRRLPSRHVRYPRPAPHFSAHPDEQTRILMKLIYNLPNSRSVTCHSDSASRIL